MLSLHTSAASLSAQASLGRARTDLSAVMTRIATGYRVNSSMEDAAGLQIAMRMKAQSSGMSVAMRNTQNAISMLQTADGALGDVNGILQRMQHLAIQAADASSSAADRNAMQTEYDALTDELSNVISGTSFAGAKLLSTAPNSVGRLGDTAGLTFQIGADIKERMHVDFSTELEQVDIALQQATPDVQVATDANGDPVVIVEGHFAGDGSPINNRPRIALADAHLPAMIKVPDGFGGMTAVMGTLTVTASPSATIARLDAAIKAVSTLRSAVGAAANRMDHVYNQLSNMSTNIQAATGRVMDVDFATESSTMTSKQMLMQSSTAMLKQTAALSTMAVSLLQ